MYSNFIFRDYLFRLSLVGLQMLESVEWSSEQKTVLSCDLKGMSSEECHNYIRLMEVNKRRVFVCGTNAFNPTCTWRRLVMNVFLAKKD